MLGLRQQVSSHKGSIGMGIGNDADLGRSCGHIDSHIVQTHRLLGSHHEAVAGTEDLEDLWNRLRTVGHSSDGLHATSLEHLAHASHTGCHKDGRMHPTLGIGRRAEHYLLTASQPCRRSQHQDGAEQGGGATGNVESHLLDGYTTLPASDARTGFHPRQLMQLGSMEPADILMSLLQGLTQLSRHLLFGLHHLFLTHPERRQFCMVELLLKGNDSSIALVPDLCQHTADHLAQFRQIDGRALNDLLYFLFRGISHYRHRLISPLFFSPSLFPP